MVDSPPGLINHWLAVWELNSFYARQPEQGEGQRMWAETAMYALGRAEAAGLDAITANVSRFHLRAGLIDDLGPTGSSLWNPDALAADILAALPLRRERAATWAANWQQRPRSEILTLRQCKSLLAPAQSIRGYLSKTPTTTELDEWLGLREQLP
ncbi:hypothetical protein [Microtetraspora fusca]|uniref:Uncharacterized protein n=1 Tax=Microtetraspora fusca TaxID=1997 RepID=A0ABW6V218_MICFU|nr:hypothetical protein [Microtetraspora fusca]